MKRYPGQTCLYLALTRDSALEIMWPVLQELNETFNLGCEFIESKLVVRYHNGARLKLVGADQKNFVKKLKGKKHPGIGVDESQDFGGHLQSLVDDVLTPCMADYKDPWLALCGTPGPVPHGYWFEVTEKEKFGYELHKWTLLDNPYMHDPKGFIDDICRRREWGPNHPTLLREYRNQWVLDLESLWIKYREEKNHYPALPGKKEDYNYILGVDIGFKDADAMAVLAWSEASPVTYLVEELVLPKQGITELTEQIQKFEKKYDFSKMVIDEGGLGKKIAEEMRRRGGINIHPADKARKQENVAWLNDSLRIGNFMAMRDSQFAQDSYKVQIDWEKSRHDKIIIKKNPHSDIIDAVLYAFKESPAFAFEKPKDKPPKGTQEWSREESDEMFDAALDHFKKESEDPYGGGL